jgi:anti-anti-sigma factor
LVAALPPGGLSVSISGREPAVELALAGELDLATVELLRRALEEIEARRPAWLVIDLSELSFIDCSGVRALLEEHRRAQARGRPLLQIRSGPAPVQRVFRLTGLECALPFVEA